MAPASREEDAEAEEERRHFAEVLKSFDHYAVHSHSCLDRMAANMGRLDASTRELIGVENKVGQLRAAVDANANVIRAITEPHQLFDSAHTDIHAVELALRRDAGLVNREAPPREADMDKVRSTLKQVVRDWSMEGAEERMQCYGPLLADLERCFPQESERTAVQVLVPGSGLGRLAWEIARRGFSSQGNEVSYHMLLASNFMLNHAHALGAVDVRPYIFQSSNCFSLEDQLRVASAPDVNPADLPAEVAFSMCAGEFTAVYGSQHGAWNCIVTCFFMDTGHSIVDYLRVIHTALAPGGFWLNLGPLLYHFADMAHEWSVELTWEELRRVILAEGFVIEEEETLSARYACNARSMCISYTCVHTVCRKPLLAAAAQTADRVGP